MRISHRAVLVGRGLTLAAAAVALAACAGTPAATPSFFASLDARAVGGAEPPRVVPVGPTVVATVPVPADPAAVAPPGAPTFAACGRSAPDPATTDLRPHVLTPDDQVRAEGRYGKLPDGGLVVESAGTLVLTDGVVGAGNGYEASTAGVTPVRVADGTVTAHVSLLVYDSEQSGRRVAFVELRLPGGPPVRWEEEPGLGIGTDGGDGGFVATATGPQADPDTLADAPYAMIDAFYPDPDDVETWNVCVLRSVAGTADGVLFSTGWGDGWYGTYLGRDADGRVVAVVSDGQVVPWELSGLPGALPEGIALDAPR